MSPEFYHWDIARVQEVPAAAPVSSPADVDAVIQKAEEVAAAAKDEDAAAPMDADTVTTNGTANGSA